MTAAPTTPVLPLVLACMAAAVASAAAAAVACLCCRRLAARRLNRSSSRLLASGGDFPEYGVGIVRAGSKCSETSSAPSLGCDHHRPSTGSSSGRTASQLESASLGSLEPSLYTRKDAVTLVTDNNGKGKDSDAAEAADAKLGLLVFRLGYDFNTSDLMVHVLKATDLVSCDSHKDFIDPFVSVKLEPPVDSKIRQTSLQRKTSCPVFNEVFKFPLDFDSLEGHRLRLQVQDYDKFSRHAAVGEFQLDLGTVDVTTDPEIVGPLGPSDEKSCNNGELLLSLSFLPCAEKLTVAVMKARNLKQAHADRSLDPYVQVTLLHDAKRLKKKRTTSKKRAANPVWNEALTFRVAPGQLAGLCVEVAVLDRDILGQDQVLGCVVLGNRRELRSGRQHWQETLAHPRRALAMWHPLVRE